ncbi:PD40 domain-containing protein [Candidatus Poribacteria bacterium]|nr:PD40 domain-containing protein [Candidatus Poribacteria bacterium]
MPISSLDLSPDGKKILFTTPSDRIGNFGTSKLRIMNFDGSGLRELLAAPPRNVLIWYGLWSPDGKWIAYSVEDPQFKEKIFVTDAQGENPFEIASDMKHHAKFNLSWFPDSQRIAFAAMMAVPAKLYIVDAAPDAKAEFMNIQLWASERIQWSRDGKRTIVIGWEPGGGGNGLFLGDAMGGNLRRLTPDNDEQGGVKWLPDGRHIIYTKNKGFVVYDVEIMDVETKGVTRLTNDGQSAFVSWYDSALAVNPSGKLATSWGAIKTQSAKNEN